MASLRPRCRRSRASRACFLGLLVGLLGSSRAWAQSSTTSPPTSTTSVGSCTGQVTATIGLAAGAIDPSSNDAPTVNSSYAPYMFGAAECDCDTNDVYMVLQISMGLAAGVAGNPTVWLGNSACTQYTLRTTTNQTQCQQIKPANVGPLSFSAGTGNIGTSTFFNIAVPARALFSPNVGSCDITTASNNVYIFIGSDQTDSGLVATCTLTVTEQVTPPDLALATSAASGDGALTVSWGSPLVGSIIPDSFQVLCADGDGNPITTSPSDPAYSTCLADGIHRRTDIFGASNIGISTGDGGTTTVTDAGLGTTSFQLQQTGSASPEATADGGVDAGVDASTTGDGGTSGGTTLTSGRRQTNSGLPAPFDHLDPRYICSDRIPTNAQSYSTRITGLTNGKPYKFTVLSIDLFGNAVGTPVFTGIPQPVDDLYARYRGDGGTAHGFCFIATAAYGDYDHPQVRILRHFRDDILATTAAGRAFIRAYYATSPPLARFIERSSLRRTIARGVLWPLVAIASLALQLDSLGLALTLTFGVPTLVLWLRRRRLRRRALLEVRA